MEEAGQLLDTIDGVTSVHSRYYDFCSEYSKVTEVFVNLINCNFDNDIHRLKVIMPVIIPMR